MCSTRPSFKRFPLALVCFVFSKQYFVFIAVEPILKALTKLGGLLGAALRRGESLNNSQLPEHKQK